MDLKDKDLTDKDIETEIKTCKAQNKKLILVVYLLAIFSIFVISYIGTDITNDIATDLFFDKPENTALRKVSIGDSNNLLDYPWGNKPNLTVFTNLDNISSEDRKYHNYTILLAMKWWKEDKSHNLSYNLNFSMVNNSKDANIIILWMNTVSTNPTDRGYTHINSTGIYDSLGEDTCDTYKPPYSRCIIEIKSNLNNEEKLFVTKHELGHVLGLKHSLNKSDFMVRRGGFSTPYLFTPSEIMYDNSIFIDATAAILKTKIFLYKMIGIALFSILIIIYFYDYIFKK